MCAGMGLGASVGVGVGTVWCDAVWFGATLGLVEGGHLFMFRLQLFAPFGRKLPFHALTWPSHLAHFSDGIRVGHAGEVLIGHHL